MAKRRMTEVVGQRNGFGQVFIEPERPGDATGDGRDFHRVREPRAQMVAGAVKENLCLVFEPAEAARVNDAVTVALVFTAPVGRWLTVFAAARVRAELGVGRESLTLDLLKVVSEARHQLSAGCAMRNEK
jgi:hypothetical protein